MKQRSEIGRNFGGDVTAFNGRAILITGGTGSFGRRLTETILAGAKPKRLIVFSRDELKQFEMTEDPAFKDRRLRFFIGDVRDKSRLLRAMDNRFFSILAHPSGRLLFERDPCAIDMERVIRKARERGCFLELNSQPKRLDLTDTFCQLAKSEGVLISINSDAHGENDFSHLKFGIDQARRGWLEKSDVLNTRPLPALRRLLRRTMQ